MTVVAGHGKPPDFGGEIITHVVLLCVEAYTFPYHRLAAQTFHIEWHFEPGIDQSGEEGTYRMTPFFSY